MTLSDLWPGFQGHDIFWSQISEKRTRLKDKVIIAQEESIPTIQNGRYTMFGDLDWPLNVSHRFVSISRASWWNKVCVCIYIYLRFNGHFPGEPGLAGVYWSTGWWRWWRQMNYESYVMKSSSQIITTNKPTSIFFYRLDALPVTQPTVSKHIHMYVHTYVNMFMLHCCTLYICMYVLHCCKGDAASQWKMVILGVSELRNPWTDRLKIWHTWLRRWDDLVCRVS